MADNKNSKKGSAKIKKLSKAQLDKLKGAAMDGPECVCTGGPQNGTKTGIKKTNKVKFDIQ